MNRRLTPVVRSDTLLDILEEHLDWNLHINLLKCKLNRAIGILSKIRHYLPKFLLNTEVSKVSKNICLIISLHCEKVKRK